jgi:hypothetical protein
MLQQINVRGRDQGGLWNLQCSDQLIRDLLTLGHRLAVCEHHLKFYEVTEALDLVQMDSGRSNPNYFASLDDGTAKGQRPAHDV